MTVQSYNGAAASQLIDYSMPILLCMLQSALNMSREEFGGDEAGVTSRVIGSPLSGLLQIVFPCEQGVPWCINRSSVLVILEIAPMPVLIRGTSTLSDQSV